MEEQLSFCSPKQLGFDELTFYSLPQLSKGNRQVDNSITEPEKKIIPNQFP